MLRLFPYARARLSRGPPDAGGSLLMEPIAPGFGSVAGTRARQLGCLRTEIGAALNRVQGGRNPSR
jgi:hypothetical protein